MFNSWVEAYEFEPIDENSTDYIVRATGAPYNGADALSAAADAPPVLRVGDHTPPEGGGGTGSSDAYRYMDWLLTVPLLLIELILVMGLDEETTRDKSWKLGSAAALMIALGYPGEMAESHRERMIYWALAMLPFLYIIFVLFVNLRNAVKEQPECARELVSQARYVTIISWLTYPFVYVLPVLGVSGTTAMVGVQIGYSISDFISKCGLGLMITMIGLRKSRARDGLLQAEETGTLNTMPVGTDKAY
eukprot:COSAG01_NODE_2373_length_7809_cov_20.194034_1_plen_248_part_00